ncbi:hypothetical protein BBJ28_00001462 [Nothophytophthora sp. Chile5]|nr:hypothetical protein BBJ28_00001462 [Nothophytophthora sp. Chile5]
MMQRSESAFVDAHATELPILGDTVSPVTPCDHPSVRGRQPRGSFSKRKLSPQHSPSSLTQSSSSSSMAPASLTERLTMMNIPTQHLKGAVFYGWLWKKGQSFKTWKKRFFLLNGCALTYYTQCCVIVSDVLGGGTQCLDLPVRGGLRVAHAELSDMTRFGLKVTSSSGRVLHIQAGDQDSRMQWLKVLEEAPKMRADMSASTVRSTLASDLSSARGYSPPQGESSFMHTNISVMSSEDEDDPQISDMQGWLYMRGSLLPGWKKRYVQLVDGRLFVQNGRRRGGDPQESEKAFEVLSAVPWSGHQHSICIRLDNHKELFVHAENDVDASRWLNALKNC